MLCNGGACGMASCDVLPSRERSADTGVVSPLTTWVGVPTRDLAMNSISRRDARDSFSETKASVLESKVALCVCCRRICSFRFNASSVTLDVAPDLHRRV